MAARRKGGRRIPMGHKPRGFQHVRSATAPIQQSAVGTQSARIAHGGFATFSGNAGYRALSAAVPSRAPVQPFSRHDVSGFYRTGLAPNANQPLLAREPFGAGPVPQASGRVARPVIAHKGRILAKKHRRA